MIIRKEAFARAGLMGNPSDGYFGKTISFTFRDFSAKVTLWETPDLQILPAQKDHSVFGSVDGLVKDVRLYGYYGGIRLLKATIKRFHDYCREKGIRLGKKNFTIKYDTNIPRGVGLAGSSAIITAAFNALMAFHGLTEEDIPKPVQANIVLSVERDELGIPAGLQDRVVQAYGGLVYMDFDRKIMEQQGFGRYESLGPKLLPDMFIVYRSNLAAGTEVFHNNIRGRFDSGDRGVVRAMKDFASYARAAREALVNREKDKIGPLMDRNFDRRASIYRLDEHNTRMVQIARGLGAHAKFTGSGGAVVGTCESGLYKVLKRAYQQEGFKIFKPTIV